MRQVCNAPPNSAPTSRALLQLTQRAVGPPTAYGWTQPPAQQPAAAAPAVCAEHRQDEAPAAASLVLLNQLQQEAASLHGSPSKRKFGEGQPSKAAAAAAARTTAIAALLTAPPGQQLLARPCTAPAAANAGATASADCAAMLPALLKLQLGATQLPEPQGFPPKAAVGAGSPACAAGAAAPPVGFPTGFGTMAGRPLSVAAAAATSSQVAFAGSESPAKRRCHDTSAVVPAAALQLSYAPGSSQAFAGTFVSGGSSALLPAAAFGPAACGGSSQGHFDLPSGGAATHDISGSQPPAGRSAAAVSPQPEAATGAFHPFVTAATARRCAGSSQACTPPHPSAGRQPRLLQAQGGAVRAPHD